MTNDKMDTSHRSIDSHVRNVESRANNRRHSASTLNTRVGETIRNISRRYLINTATRRVTFCVFSSSSAIVVSKYRKIPGQERTEGRREGRKEERKKEYVRDRGVEMLRRSQHDVARSRTDAARRNAKRIIDRDNESRGSERYTSTRNYVFDTSVY